MTISSRPRSLLVSALFLIFALLLLKFVTILSKSELCTQSVVIANLSGFDGSPESLRNLQLEYGAEIGRAVTNFKGPIVFCVVSRYHGGSFVVFSKALNENLESESCSLPLINQRGDSQEHVSN